MIGNRSNTKNIVIIILIVLIFALGGLSVYLMFFKEETVKCKEEKNNDKKDVIVQNKIDIYGKKYETGAYFVCNHPSETDDCKEVLFEIKTETPNASIIHMNLGENSSFQYIVFYDKEVKLYNVKDETISKLNVDINGDIIWLSEGFINNSEEESYYFDLKLDKKTLEKYDYIYQVNDIYSDNILSNPKYLEAKKGNNTVLIDFKTGNILITLSNKDYERIGFEKAENYIIASLYQTESTTKVIYNSKGEKKVELKENQTFEIKGSKIIVYEQSLNKVKEY